MIRVMRDAARVLSMPCREHTELLSRQLDAPLTRGESVGLRIHLVICAGCRKFKAQLKELRFIARSLGDRVDADEGMPASIRERIEAKIRTQSKG